MREKRQLPIENSYYSMGSVVAVCKHATVCRVHSRLAFRAGRVTRILVTCRRRGAPFSGLPTSNRYTKRF